MFFYVG
jgi:hypothetical protein